MAWSPPLDEKIVIAVRAAAGPLREVAKRFGLRQTTVWRIKHGVTGAHVPYTPTVLGTGERAKGRGLKLEIGQIARIRAERRRDRAASEELADEFGVTASRVREIWRELDFMAAHWAAISKADSEVVAGSVGQV